MGVGWGGGEIHWKKNTLEFGGNETTLWGLEVSKL